MIAIGAFGDVPSTLKPCGSTVTRSPWLIQHRIFFALAPDAFEQRRVFGDRHLGAAELAVVPTLHLAAKLMRHRLLAVANAEHRHAGVVDRLGASGASLSSTEAGPPERITAFGFISRKAASAFW